VRVGGRILILDDAPGRDLAAAIRRAAPAAEVRHLPAGREPARVVHEVRPDVLLLGPGLIDAGGAASALRAIRGQHPTLPVLAVSDGAATTTAVAVMKAGATDWVDGAGVLDALPALLRELPAERRGAARAPMRPEGDGATGPSPRLIGRSGALEQVRDLVRTAAQSDAPVLIEGETGTGKEVVAQSIHALGHRARAALVPLNCAAIPESLAESELFGHSRGAFTGAVQDRPGALVLADGGTLFLDEIEDLPLPIQAKLLRVVQDGFVRPLGGLRPRRVQVRLIAASNRALWGQVERGAFRRDLFYRLRVLAIEVPPLRERRDDILDLAAHFIARFNLREGTCFRLPPPPRCRSLLEHTWPGNVRELENTLESFLITARAGGHDLGDLLAGRDLRGPTWLDERARILRTLDEHRWNRQRAAAALGISRVTLWRRMGRHGIRDPLAHAVGETT
jgi:DNA-binding NtrC family response regulator